MTTTTTTASSPLLCAPVLRCRRSGRRRRRHQNVAAFSKSEDAAARLWSRRRAMTTTTTTTTTLAKRRGGDEEEEKDDDEEGTRTTFNRPRTTTTTEEEEGDETRRIAFQLLSNSMYACDDDDDDDDQSEEERRRVFATTKPRRDAHKKEEATNRTKREEEEAKSMELARKLRRRLEAEGADEKRRRRRRRQKMAHSIDASSDDDDTNDDDDDDDTSTRYHRRRVQTHELVREASGEYQQMRMESTRGTTVSTVARDREHSNRSSTRPPLKGRQQKATTITGGFIRVAKPKTFETLKIVLDAVADRYDVNVGKTVWTNTLWKYVSREWDFSHSEQDDDDDDDVLKIIDVVNGRDAHQLIELWAKRRKMFRRSVVEAQSDDNNDENENENENGQMNTIASELERIKSRAIRINPNAKGIVLLATARAYDDLGSTVAAKKAWTDVEEHYFHDDSKGMVELKIERLCSCARHVNRLDEAKKCFLDVALTMKPRTGLKRKAFTAACKVINQTKDVEFAKTVYDSLKRNRESGDAFIVATLISAFGFGVENNGRRPTQIEEMKKLGLQCWSRAKKKNVVLDGQCYSSIVGLMCKARDASKAMEIIRELENSEKWMARGTIGAKSFAAAFKYEQQKQCNDADDDESSTNDNNANRSKNRNDYDIAAAERLRQLKKQQFKELRDDREAKKNRENVEPAYAQVMHFLCDSKQPKQALIVFQNMQRNGVPPSKSTYRALYKALRYAGGRNGLRVSNKTAARYAIDVVTSNSQSTLKGGSPPFGTGGQKRRYRSSSSSSLTVDRPTTSKDESKRHDLECILEICARAGLADEAIEVRDRLRFGFGDEIANAPEIRRCVVEAFQRSGPERVEEALAVYNEEMMCDENGRAKNANSQLSPEFWIFLSLALRDANLLSENVAILKECLLTTKKTTSNATTVQQKKYYPIAAANIVIDHCAKENVPGEAIDIFDLINRDDNPLIADSVTYLALLKSIKKMSKNGPATAERVMEEMISKRGEGFVTTEHLNSLLAAYARGGEKFLKKSEETFERIVRMRQSSKPDEFEFITMLYAYSVASKFRKATEFYDRFANTFASDGERKPRIFNAAIRATILEPRLFRDVETIEEVNVLREMYADMTRRTGVVGDPSVQKKREDKDDDGEECDKEVVGVNSSSSSSKNNAYLRKQSENALKMLTRVAAEVNAKVTISSSASAPPSPSTSTSTTSTTRKPLHPASRNEGEDEDITTIDASSLTPTETRSAVLTLLLEFKKARQKHAIRVVNLSKENADAISRLAGDVRIDFHTIAIRKTSSSSSSKFEKDIAFDRDDVDAWLRKQHHQHQRER